MRQGGKYHQRQPYARPKWLLGAERWARLQNNRFRAEVQANLICRYLILTAALELSELTFSLRNLRNDIIRPLNPSQRELLDRLTREFYDCKEDNSITEYFASHPEEFPAFAVSGEPPIFPLVSAVLCREPRLSRIHRIASAAAPKKCPRLFQCCT